MTKEELRNLVTDSRNRLIRAFTNHVNACGGTVDLTGRTAFIFGDCDGLDCLYQTKLKRVFIEDDYLFLEYYEDGHPVINGIELFSFDEIERIFSTVFN